MAKGGRASSAKFKSESQARIFTPGFSSALHNGEGIMSPWEQPRVCSFSQIYLAKGESFLSGITDPV